MSRDIFKIYKILFLCLKITTIHLYSKTLDKLKIDTYYNSIIAQAITTELGGSFFMVIIPSLYVKVNIVENGYNRYFN